MKDRSHEGAKNVLGSAEHVLESLEHPLKPKIKKYDLKLQEAKLHNLIVGKQKVF